MPGRPGDGEAWTEVSMVVDAVLGFKAESVTEVEIGAEAPLILIEKRAIEEQRAGERILNHSGLILRGSAGEILGN